MSETGWPLIPREVLPAPVPPAPFPPAPRRSGRGPRLPASPGEAGRQLSIFGAETTEPSPADLAGLLAGPGRLGRMGGTARIAVRVDAAWRVHVLVGELVSRGLVVNWHPIEEVRGDTPSIAPKADDSPGNAIKVESSARRSPGAATFDPDPDLDPVPDLPSDVDFADHPAVDHPAADPVSGDDRPTAAAASGADRATAAPVSGADRVTAAPGDPGTGVAGEPGDESDAESPGPHPGPRFEVVTAYSSRLNGLARAWPDAAARLFLSGPRLRLWVAAAGEPVAGGYALGLDPAGDSSEQLRAIDAALVRAGLAGRFTDDRRHYVIAGQRRLRRLAELVGERPAAAPPEFWPGGAGA